MKASENTNLLRFVWLTLCCGPASIQAFRIYSKFQDINVAYKSDDYSDFKLTAETLSKLSNKDLTGAHEIVKKCETMGIRVVTFEDDEYPIKLRKIKIPPLVLYFKGKTMDFDKRISVGMVGTRSFSEPGRQSAEYLGKYYGNLDTIVISGLAKGIDSIAQRAAVNAGGRVVGVLGNAIDKIYPKENAPLFNRLYRYGLVISEYWPGCATRAASFPQRNRIIAGLSDVVVVIEAPKGSGALITADHALQQGKKVYVAPMPFSEDNAGGQWLINTGVATILGDPMDLLDGYETDIEDIPVVFHSSVDYSEELSRETLTLAEKRDIIRGYIIEELEDNGPETLDEILSKTAKYTLHEIAYGITELQLDCIIRKIAGGRYETVPPEHINEYRARLKSKAKRSTK